MIEVAAFMTTMNFLASTETPAAASALGVSTKPPRMSTPSRTTSSCASRLATSGATPPGVPADELELLAGNRVALLLDVELDGVVHLRGGIGELAGVRHDEADLDRRPAHWPARLRLPPRP